MCGCCSTVSSTMWAGTSRRSRRHSAEGPGSAAEDWVSHLYDTGGVITADYFEGHDNLITLNHSSSTGAGVRA